MRITLFIPCACLTPEGIRAEGGPPWSGTCRWCCCGAQRTKASARRAGSACDILRPHELVLNARRHRRGGRLPIGGERITGPRCSTPEGIGAEGGLPLGTSHLGWSPWAGGGWC